MFKKHHALFIGTASLLAFSACSSGTSPDDIGGQFWQRVSVSESIYQQGPKAQQMLNRDISRCVSELRELERLGVIKNAIPAEYGGHGQNADEKELAAWDSPARDRHLYSEHSTYLDFESCMGDKGWERVEHVPFDVARKGRKNYIIAHQDYDYAPEDGYDGVTKTMRKHTDNTDQSVVEYGGADYSNVNE